MLGGLLIDLLVVAAIGAFAWAGRELGAAASIERAIASAAGFVAAILLRDPLGGTIRSVFGTSVDLSRLLAMLAVGIGGYIAATRLLARRRGVRAADVDGEEDEDAWSGEDEDAGSDTVAALAGGALGAAWALVFVAMLVLLPAATFVTRAAAASFTGSLVIAQEGGLRWLSAGFPHYTQTLPKGRDGAVVGERERLDLRGEVVPREVSEDAEVVLAAINRARRSRSVQVLAFNPDVAEVAQRHAAALAVEETLSYSSPGGAALDGRVRAALGDAGGSFRDEIGVEVAWAHGPANAAGAMLGDDRGGSLLRGAQWSEIGIGAANAGWFNGRIYVVVLVGSAPAADAPAATGQPGGVDPFTGAPEGPDASEEPLQDPGTAPREPAPGDPVFD